MNNIKKGVSDFSNLLAIIFSSGKSEILFKHYKCVRLNNV